VHVVVLHRHTSAGHAHALASSIRSQHLSAQATAFEATVMSVQPHLRMLSVGGASDAALSYLSGHSDVKFVQKSVEVKVVEPVEVASTSSTYSWGLDRIDQSDLPLDNAAYLPPGVGQMDGGGVSVYVLDTGIDTLHTEFVGRNVTNIFDAYSSDGAVSADNDVNGHGTHCAGTAGGTNVGVARGTHIFGLKVLNDFGSGSTETIVAGMNKVLEDRVNDPFRPMVVSMSLGGYCGSLCSTDAMVEAVEILSENNVTVVVAAGNSADDACMYTPGAAPSAVTVGATDSDDSFAYYSSFGSCVDVLAPGTLVNSACASSSSSSCANGDQYVEISGTSMSCPHVSGVIALWLAQSGDHPTPSSVDVKTALQCTSARNKVTGLASGTLNMLLQLPTTATSVVDVDCDIQFSCNATDLSTGEVCSGRGECVFGECLCEDDYIGDNCENYSPNWLYWSWCCGGGDLADSVSPPFNTISFLWTDLNPSYSGNIYHGSVDDDTYVIVFDDVPSYASSSCRISMEVVFHKNKDIKLIYLHNDIGVDASCAARVVSIGLKGASGGAFEFLQVYGPSTTGMPNNATVLFSKTLPPTSAPSISYSPTAVPSAAPSGVPTITMEPTIIPSSLPSMSPIVWPTGAPSLIPSVVPSAEPSVTHQPSLQPTIRFEAYRVSETAYTGSYFGSSGYGQLTNLQMYDDHVVALELPFMYKFYRDTFSHAYLSSNGLVTFGSAPPSSTSAASRKDPTSKPHKAEVGGSDGDVHISRSRKVSTSRNGRDGPIPSAETNAAAGDVVHVVVLHRHTSAGHAHALASSIRSQHLSAQATAFEATVMSVQPHLRMLSVGGASDAALSYLSGHSDVKFVQKSVEVKVVEPVEVASTSSTYSWGLDRIDQSDLPLDNAAYLPPGVGQMDGGGVSVYVLDTGIDTLHTEFVGRNVTNIFDAYSSDGAVSADNDVNGHGTHCAGTAGGTNVGVARGTHIFGLKVLNDFGSGSTETIVAGMNKVLEDRVNDPFRPMVVSMSLGGYCGSLCSTDAMVEAVEILSENNVTVVVAAGNSADDACMYTPGAAPSAVTVGATDSDDSFAYYSSFGSCVDVLAPGTLVNSACASSSSSSCANGDQYVEISGTSMSCPHVSGVIALWLAQSGDHPTPSSVDVKTALQCTSARNKVTGLASGTLNMLLQLPTTATSVVDVDCDIQFSCNATDLSTGEVCSGRGECVFGECLCEDDYIGDNCENYSPNWLYWSWCCGGGDLADSVSPPFNTISFLWTDLNPSYSGNIYHGSVDDDTYAIVFDDVPSYASSSCRVSVEVILHRVGTIELIYSNNDIGAESYCEDRMVSIGMKGPQDDIFEYFQMYGPSYSGILSSGHIKFVSALAPTASPSTSTPTTSVSPTAPSVLPSTSFPTVSPTVSPTPFPTPWYSTRAPTPSPVSVPSPTPSPVSVPSPTVTGGYYDIDITSSSTSYFEGDYSSLTPVSLSDDAVVTASLPFSFRFYDSFFERIGINSNGVVSFIGTHNENSIFGTWGQELNDPYNGFDFLAFMWTDLNPSNGGMIYAGSVSADIYGVVFNNIPKFGSDECRTNIEVVLHRNGDMEVLYLDNEVGAVSGCIGGSISIGIKGPFVDYTTVQYSQLYGPSGSGIIGSGHINFDLITGDEGSEPGTVTSLSIEAEFGLQMQASTFLNNLNLQYSVRYAYAKSLGRNVSVDDVTVGLSQNDVLNLLSVEHAESEKGVATHEILVVCSVVLQMEVRATTEDIVRVFEDMSASLLSASSDGSFSTLISSTLSELDPSDTTVIEVSTLPTVLPIDIIVISAAPTATAVPTESSGLTGGAIAGIVIGSLCFCCCAYFLVFFIVSATRKKVSPAPTQVPPSVHSVQVETQQRNDFIPGQQFHVQPQLQSQQLPQQQPQQQLFNPDYRPTVQPLTQPQMPQPLQQVFQPPSSGMQVVPQINSTLLQNPPSQWGQAQPLMPTSTSQYPAYQPMSISSDTLSGPMGPQQAVYVDPNGFSQVNNSVAPLAGSHTDGPAGGSSVY